MVPQLSRFVKDRVLVVSAFAGQKLPVIENLYYAKNNSSSSSLAENEKKNKKKRKKGGILEVPAAICKIGKLLTEF